MSNQIAAALFFILTVLTILVLGWLLSAGLDGKPSLDTGLSVQIVETLLQSYSAEDKAAHWTLTRRYDFVAPIIIAAFLTLSLTRVGTQPVLTWMITLLVFAVLIDFAENILHGQLLNENRAVILPHVILTWGKLVLYGVPMIYGIYAILAGFFR